MTGRSRFRWPKDLKHTAIRDRWFRKFDRLKPGLSLQRVAKSLRESYTSVYRWADFFGYEFPDLRREGRVSNTDWDKVNWRQRDSEIARKLGVSRERVRQVRASRGVGPSAHRLRVQEFARWIKSNHRSVNGMSVARVLETFGGKLSLQVARRLLRNAGVQPHEPGSRWRTVDWQLPNRELARLWNVSPKYLANIRARLGVGPSRFKLNGRKAPKNAGFQKALAAEEKRARTVKKSRAKRA